MFWETILLALRAIRRNVMRSFLTILGIVIGVASVVALVILGGGTTVQVTEQIASLGSNLLMVQPGQRMGPGAASAPAPFDLDDAKAIGREISSIAAVAASSSQSVTAVSGNENWSTRVTGSDNEYFKVGNWTIEAGRQFADSELSGGRAVCILGATVRRELFGGQDPVGSKIRLRKLSCQVIGVLKTRGQSMMGMDQDDLILLPLRTFQRRIAGSQDVSLIQLSVQQGASTEKVQGDIEQLMRERRHISASEADDFSVMDLKEIAAMLTGTTRVLTALLSFVAAVSLLVGGIGIMNIMLVSVTERTREIGTRLAIGAVEGQVLMQFLVEAMVLSSFGGLIGILLGLAVAGVGAYVLAVPFVPNWGIVVLAFMISAAIGVIFGYFPARQAARLDPIEALRHE